MWHKPKQLNLLANLLYIIASGLFVYLCISAFIRLPIFPINTVEVHGDVDHVTKAQVRLIADQYLKGNFFTLKLVEAKAAFEKLPWTRKVSVRRRWPSTLSVEVEEHHALARWGDSALVNTHGELFQGATSADLPVLYGAEADVREVAAGYVQFGKILRAVDLKVVEVKLSPRRAWEVKTDKALHIALGRMDMQARLKKFSAAYQTVLKQLNTNIQYADLRYTNGFAVRRTNAKKLSMQALPTMGQSAERWG